MSKSEQKKYPWDHFIGRQVTVILRGDTDTYPNRVLGKLVQSSQYDIRIEGIDFDVLVPKHAIDRVISEKQQVTSS